MKPQTSELLQRMSGELLDGRSSEWLFDYLFDALSLCVPYDRIGISVLEGAPGKERLRLIWLRSRIQARYLPHGFSARIAGSSLETVVRSRQPRIINDLENQLAENTNSPSAHLALLDGIRSSLTYPLIAEGEPIGIVFFSSFKKNTYSSIHLEPLKAVAQQISLIVCQSEIRKQKVQTAEAKRSINNLIHDLRAPLCVIEGFGEAASTEGWFDSLRPEAKKFFKVMHRNSRHMLQMINELMELSEAKQVTGHQLNPQSVCLSSFLSEIEDVGRSILGLKQIQLDLDYSPPLPETMSFDPSKVRRVFENLFSNAAKFSNRGTTVKLRIGRTNDRLLFQVADQGIGISNSEIGKLFREFGRTSSRPTEGEPSTGLGLVLAAEFVHQHGGEISVESEVGIGSVFSFSIPIKE